MSGSDPATEVESPSILQALPGGLDDQLDKVGLAEGGQPRAQVTGWGGLCRQRWRWARVQAEVDKTHPDQVGAQAPGPFFGAVAVA